MKKILFVAAIASLLAGCFPLFPGPGGDHGAQQGGPGNHAPAGRQQGPQGGPQGGHQPMRR